MWWKETQPRRSRPKCVIPERLFGKTQTFFKAVYGRRTGYEPGMCFSLRTIFCCVCFRKSKRRKTPNRLKKTCLHLLTSITTMHTCSCKMKHFVIGPTWQRSVLSTTMWRSYSAQCALRTWNPLQICEVFLFVACTNTESTTRARKSLSMKPWNSGRSSSSKVCSTSLDSSRTESQRSC